MVKIKGLIIFEKQNLKEKLKAAFGVYETEIKEFNGKSVYVLKTGKYNDTVRKRFIRKNIRELAFYPENEKNRNVLSGEGFRLILRKNLLKNHTAEILRKYAGSHGIAKGKLTVAIAFSDPTEMLDNLKTISEWIFEIILTGKKNGRTLAAADDFYKETGISVILKERITEDSCDILVAEREEYIKKDYTGNIICFEDVKESGDLKIIKGVKLLIPEELQIENIEDSVISELFDIKFKISKLKT